MLDLFSKLDATVFATSKLNLTPDVYQLRVLDPSIRRGILNCTRQWGKSTIVAARATHHALTNPDSLTLILSPSSRQSAEFLRKAKHFLRKLNIKTKSDGDNEISLLLPNNSRLVGLPGNKDTVRGFSGVSLLLVDEAARVSDDLFNSVYPSIAACPTATVWLMSTPNGRQGFFYKYWIDELCHYTKISVDAQACPRIDKTFLAEQRIVLPTRDFEQEYMCQFHDASGAVFSLEVLSRCIREDLFPLFPVTTQTPLGTLRANSTPPPNSTQDSRVPTTYTRSNSEYHFYLGIDLGQQHDHTAIAIIQRTLTNTGRRNHYDYQPIFETQFSLAHIEQFPTGTPYTEIVEFLRKLMQREPLIHRTDLIVDASGVGRPIYEQIAARVKYVHRKFDITITGGPNANNNNIPKRDLIATLQLAMETGQLLIPATLPNRTAFTEELANFKSRIRQSGHTQFEAPAREHDDMVIAVSLAAWRAFRPRPKPVQHSP